MYPGYAEQPYVSPIFVNTVEPGGNRQLRLQFFNAGYAAGVQNFDKLVQSIRRTAAYLACREVDGDPDRLMVIHELSPLWLQRCFLGWDAGERSHAVAAELFDDNVQDVLNRLWPHLTGG